MRSVVRSIDESKNLGAGAATHCYVSDVNRLVGWSSGLSGCNPTPLEGMGLIIHNW